MKKIISLFFILCVSVVTIFSMEYKPIYKCDINNCNLVCFSSEMLDQHKRKHDESCQGRRYIIRFSKKTLLTPVTEPTPLVQVILKNDLTRILPYKKFCELEANMSFPYGATKSISAFPIMKLKSKIGKKYWYIKKDECCKQLADQHSSKYKLHILQEHPERYNATMHPADCLACEYIKSRQTDLHPQAL